jgi:hypothetical protein
MTESGHKTLALIASAHQGAMSTVAMAVIVLVLLAGLIFYLTQRRRDLTERREGSSVNEVNRDRSPES